MFKGLEYRERYRTKKISDPGLKIVAGQLARRMAKLVGPIKKHAVNERMMAFLEKHVEELFTFLRHPGTDATNWRGERAIRPAVVQRNAWGGNRTEAGAKAQSILMSEMRTCLQRLADPFECFRHQLTSTTPLVLPLPIAVR